MFEVIVGETVVSGNADRVCQALESSSDAAPVAKVAGLLLGRMGMCGFRASYDRYLTMG